MPACNDYHRGAHGNIQFLGCAFIIAHQKADSWIWQSVSRGELFPVVYHGDVLSGERSYQRDRLTDMPASEDHQLKFWSDDFYRKPDLSSLLICGVDKVSDSAFCCQTVNGREHRI